MMDEQLDRVYRDFFRREMPAELPPLVKSEPARAARPERRSRATLAVAIAALLGLGLWLSSNATPPNRAKEGPSKLLKDSEADGKKILDAAKDPPMPDMP
jgi:ferric-dicitrate binding protein FerR (iron transport regulator)